MRFGSISPTKGPAIHSATASRFASGIAVANAESGSVDRNLRSVLGIRQLVSGPDFSDCQGAVQHIEQGLMELVLGTVADEAVDGIYDGTERASGHDQSPIGPAQDRER